MQVLITVEDEVEVVVVAVVVWLPFKNPTKTTFSTTFMMVLVGGSTPVHLAPNMIVNVVYRSTQCFSLRAGSQLTIIPKQRSPICIMCAPSLS
jgi:hypothetical protein